jgi:uncharacterized protein
MGSRVMECKYCKKLFQSFGSNICPACVEEMENNFEIVKEYIYNNPGANVIDIARETGVPEKTVLYYLKEGRLSIEDEKAGLTCEKCKKPISNGRYCKECQVTLENTLYKSYLQSKQSKAEDAKKAFLGKMHVGRE